MTDCYGTIISVYYSIEGLCERTEYVRQLWNRKWLVKPVTWQNILSCSVLPPKIVVHDDAFSVILWTSADICVVHDNLWWKNQTTLQVFCCVTGFMSDFLGQNNRTTRYNRFWRAGCSQLEYVHIWSVY